MKLQERGDARGRRGADPGLGRRRVRLHRPPNAERRQGLRCCGSTAAATSSGSATQDDALCRRFAHATRHHRRRPSSTGWRPRHPYPASLEDCYSALTWLAALPVRRPHARGDRRRQRRAAAWPRRSRCWPATAARSTSPRSCSSTRCSTTGRGRRTGLDDPNHRLWTQRPTSSAGSLPRRRRSERRRARPPRRPRADYRRRGSASAPLTCSTTRTSPTPSGCKAAGVPCDILDDPRRLPRFRRYRRESPSVAVVLRQSAGVPAA